MHSPTDHENTANGHKRRKVTRACDQCKSRKRRCTGERPCRACAAVRRDCTFEASYTRGRWNGAELADTPVAAPPSHELSARQADGIRANSTRDPSPEPEDPSRTGQYLGPASPFAFLRRASSRFGRLGAAHDYHDAADVGASIFSYGDKPTPSISKDVWALPPEATAGRLVSIYFDFAAPTYRVLHRPSVVRWVELLYRQQGSSVVPPVRQALVLLVMATALLYDKEDCNNASDTSVSGERFFQAAQTILDHEAGPVRLESAQARLAASLYLLNTSRLNRAWYMFGTTCQLLIALGLHRQSSDGVAEHDAVVEECRRRTYWSAYTIDGYLSVILGRQHFLSEDGVDQAFPQTVDDEDITASQIVTRSVPRDSVLTAMVLHAKLARIFRSAAKDYHPSQRASEQDHIHRISRLNGEVSQWRETLPVFLSGIIHPNTLIPVFRRQLTVLRLACAHATMLINRPLLLAKRADAASLKPHVKLCLDAARQTLDTVIDFATESRLYPAFWNTQYVAFTALSIVYIWIIQSKSGRLVPGTSDLDTHEIMRQAEAAQAHLGEATSGNAPNLRYGMLLSELQQEARKLLDSAASGLLPLSRSSQPAKPAQANTTLFPPAQCDQPDFEQGILDYGLDASLWSQLDAFPFASSVEMNLDSLFQDWT